MFDLSRVTEMIGGFLGQTSAGNAVNDLIADKLSSLNIDPSMLEGLGAGQITDLLAQNGIDISQLAPEQLNELLGQLGPSSPIAEALSGLLSNRGGHG